MSAADLRQPALVTEEFRMRLAGVLAPLGFEARAQAKSLVRKRGKNVHRVDFQSSHRNAPGHAVVWPCLLFEDAATRKLVKGWRAGGNLDGTFELDVPTNVADPNEADALVAIIERRMTFFDWLEDPRAVLRDVSHRYMPGLAQPQRVAPYLRAHLGDDAVLTYVGSLVRGRSELAPAFVTELEQGRAGEQDADSLDHGTQLALALRENASSVRPECPADVVRSSSLEARHLRCFFGRQLRAWGEVEAAHALRTLDDKEVKRLREAQEKLGVPVVESVDAVRLVLARVGGRDRAPRRQAPEPRLFQYHEQHSDPFGTAPRDDQPNSH